MDEKRIGEIFSDKVFVENLLEMDTPEEVQAALKEKGIEFTEEDVIHFRDVLLTKMAENLPDELDCVSGGVEIHEYLSQRGRHDEARKALIIQTVAEGVMDFFSSVQTMKTIANGIVNLFKKRW